MASYWIHVTNVNWVFHNNYIADVQMNYHVNSLLLYNWNLDSGLHPDTSHRAEFRSAGANMDLELTWVLGANSDTRPPASWVPDGTNSESITGQPESAMPPNSHAKCSPMRASMVWISGAMIYTYMYIIMDVRVHIHTSLYIKHNYM